MLGPFYSDAKKAKKNRRSSSSSSHFIFPRDFSGNTVDTDIVNTLLEPLWPTDVPFGDYKTETKEFFATKLIFLAVSSYQVNRNNNKCIGLVYKWNTDTHPFNGNFSWTIRVSWYQKGKINLDFTEARDNEWQWRQLGHMQVCT